MAKQEFTGERHWYAIHTYSGYENAVLRNLNQRIESLGMENKIFAVVKSAYCFFYSQAFTQSEGLTIKA
jgi:hypothetical protein